MTKLRKITLEMIVCKADELNAFTEQYVIDNPDWQIEAKAWVKEHQKKLKDLYVEYVFSGKKDAFGTSFNTWATKAFLGFQCNYKFLFDVRAEIAEILK